MPLGKLKIPKWFKPNAKIHYNKAQLKIGTKIELEHTTSKQIARRIAKHHLAEIPDYYTRLVKLERAAGIKD